MDYAHRDADYAAGEMKAIIGPVHGIAPDEIMGIVSIVVKTDGSVDVGTNAGSAAMVLEILQAAAIKMIMSAMEGPGESEEDEPNPLTDIEPEKAVEDLIRDLGLS